MSGPATPAADGSQPSPKLIGIAVVVHAGRVLVGLRGPEGPLPGMAEFPGGKCEPGETPAECALRECREETGLDVEAVATLDDILWTYPHGTVHLHFLRCRPAAPFDGSVWRPPFRWVDADELAALDFPAANQAVLRWLAANLSALA